MIKTFNNKRTEQLFGGQCHASFRAFRRAAERKLAMIDAATSLEDLLSPPGNRLEALYGDRAGQHSIRINKQWRVCFVWHEGHAYDVEIVDYH